MRIEIAANSIASALAAQEGGAHRIELCAALEVGGLTPSYAQIALARERIRIPIYVLIRPRGGDFVYDDLEFETMRRDVEACAAIGCDGVVIGALDARGDVDARCATLIGAAGKLGVTFHRAFDTSPDLARALEQVVALGCERVLTSGGAATAIAGIEAIRDVVIRAAGRIVVMPGSGVAASNVARLQDFTGATEFHASAKKTLASNARRLARDLPEMTHGETRTDVETVRALVAAACHKTP